MLQLACDLGLRLFYNSADVHSKTLCYRSSVRPAREGRADKRRMKPFRRLRPSLSDGPAGISMAVPCMLTSILAMGDVSIALPEYFIHFRTDLRCRTPLQTDGLRAADAEHLGDPDLLRPRTGWPDVCRSCRGACRELFRPGLRLSARESRALICGYLAERHRQLFLISSINLLTNTLFFSRYQDLP